MGDEQSQIKTNYSFFLHKNCKLIIRVPGNQQLTYKGILLSEDSDTLLFKDRFNGEMLTRKEDVVQLLLEART